MLFQISGVDELDGDEKLILIKVILYSTSTIDVPARSCACLSQVDLRMLMSEVCPRIVRVVTFRLQV